MINCLHKFFSRFKRSNQIVCSICEQVFSENKITEIDDLILCPQDLTLYKRQNWAIIKKGKSNPDNPQDALEIQDLHIKLKNLGIPSFIKFEYEIINDQITTIFLLYIPTNMVKQFKDLIPN